jgi:DNA-binding transcriptional LysR family regulator
VTHLTDLETFVRVAEAGSFTQAAKSLGIPKSTVSRRVSRLESTLGVELLHRGPRTFRLTERGERLRTRAAPPLRELLDAERAASDADDAPRGVLRLTTAADLGGTMMFARWMTGFRAEYPEVTLDVELTNRLVDLVDEGFDIGIRMHLRPLADSTALMSRRLARVSSGLYATPEYLDARGRPRTIADLKKHDCIHARPMGDGFLLRRRRDGETVRVPFSPVMSATDFTFAVSAVRAGAGIGMLPDIEAVELVNRGALEPVLRSYRSPEGSMSLVWPTTRHLSPRVRAFIDYLVELIPDSGLAG